MTESADMFSLNCGDMYMSHACDKQAGRHSALGKHLLDLYDLAAGPAMLITLTILYFCL